MLKSPETRPRGSASVFTHVRPGRPERRPGFGAGTRPCERPSSVTSVASARLGLTSAIGQKKEGRVFHTRKETVVIQTHMFVLDHTLTPKIEPAVAIFRLTYAKQGSDQMTGEESFQKAPGVNTPVRPPCVHLDGLVRRDENLWSKQQQALARRGPRRSSG